MADIHGKPEKIALIRKKTEALNPDALIIAGDVTNYANATDVVDQLNHMPVPVLAIRGNTDLKKVDHLLNDYPNTSSLHLKRSRSEQNGLFTKPSILARRKRSDLGNSPLKSD